MDEPIDLLTLVRGGKPPAAASLRGLGDAWRVAEQALASEFHANPRAARRRVDAYRRLARRSGEREARGRAARLAGSYLAYTGDFAAARPRFAEAVSLLTGAARDHARLGLAVAAARTGRAGDAERACRAVRRSAVARGDRVLAASADLNAGLAIHEHGAPARALPLYRRARAAFAAAGQPVYAAIAAQNLANALVLLDRYDEAQALYAEAGAALKSAGSDHEAARVGYNRGALLVALDRLGDAERELASSERSLIAGGDRALAALARLDRGEALLRAGLVAEASRVIESASRALARGAPANETFRAKALRARAAIARGDFAVARRILGRTTHRTEIAWDADRCELAGLAFAGERRFGEARRLLVRAAAGFGGSRPAAMSRASCAAGWCALEAGDASAARRHAKAAARVADRLGVPGLAHAAAALLFLVEDAAGRRAAADAALVRALATLESSREGLVTDAMRSAVLRGRERWFARAVRHLLAGPRGEERALALVERWRARALVDLMSSAARVEDDGGRLASLRARVAALERRLEGAASPSFLRAPGVAPATRVAARLVRAERDLEHAAAAQSIGAGSTDRSIGSLRELLAPSAAVVSLFADDDGGLAFVVRRSGVRVVRMPAGAHELQSLVEELHFRFARFARGPQYVAAHARRLTAETERLLAALAERSIAPLADELRDVERLVVVPHGAWHQVPFAALPFRGARLVDAVSLSMSPSLSALAADVAPATGRPLVLAVADGVAPTIADEGRAVARIAADALHLEGAAAVSAALATSTPPRFVHIASHGRFRADVPAMSGVRLADGWLRALDFHGLALGGSLVVLSGCETGVSRVDAGGELRGLVRGVFASGAADLVVSSWRVDDAACARLMARFHEFLGAGRAPDAALAAAQREAAASGLSPWHWAAFGAWTRRLPV